MTRWKFLFQWEKIFFTPDLQQVKTQCKWKLQTDLLHYDLRPSSLKLCQFPAPQLYITNLLQQDDVVFSTAQQFSNHGIALGQLLAQVAHAPSAQEKMSHSDFLWMSLNEVQVALSLLTSSWGRRPALWRRPGEPCWQISGPVENQLLNKQLSKEIHAEHELIPEMDELQ